MRYDRHLGFFAPIAYDHGLRKYYYSIPGYSIRRLALKQEEFESLVFASRLVDQFRQVKVLENVEAAIQKIADQLKIRQTISEAEIGEFVDFEKPADTKGSEYIGPLLNAIWRKKVVRILYHGFNKPKPYPQTLHPYLLKEYRHRWYIFGYNDYWKELRTYSLDRILSI